MAKTSARSSPFVINNNNPIRCYWVYAENTEFVFPAWILFFYSEISVAELHCVQRLLKTHMHVDEEELSAPKQ